MSHPEETFPNTGQSILDVLRPKHPKACPSTAQSMEAYGGKPPGLVPVEITDAAVVTVLRRLLGSESSGGVDSISLQHWLLRFGMEILGLCHIVWEFRDCMAKGSPPWAAYREPISGRLISLNKCPRIRPVGVGETWRQMLEKCVLVVTGADSKEA